MADNSCCVPRFLRICVQHFGQSYNNTATIIPIAPTVKKIKPAPADFLHCAISLESISLILRIGYFLIPIKYISKPLELFLLIATAPHNLGCFNPLVLGYSFCDSQLIYEIATEIFELPFLLRQERVFKNRFGQLIYEDILYFENYKADDILCDEAIEHADRTVAIRMLIVNYCFTSRELCICFFLEFLTGCGK